MIVMPSDTEVLVRTLATRRGTTPEAIVREAVEAQARLEGVTVVVRRKPDLRKLREISDHAAALPVYDHREPDEILGYNEDGVPE